MSGHNKITAGFVIQSFVTLNGKHICTGQEFIAGDKVDYETNDGDDSFIIDIDIDKEVYCPFEMKTPKQIPSPDNAVKFVCPDCQGARLECCETGSYKSEVLDIDEKGDFDFGEISASGDVERFQCLTCGHVLGDGETRFAQYPVTEHDEVVQWCKKNCNQE